MSYFSVRVDYVDRKSISACFQWLNLKLFWNFENGVFLIVQSLPSLGHVTVIILDIENFTTGIMSASSLWSLQSSCAFISYSCIRHIFVSGTIMVNHLKILENFKF